MENQEIFYDALRNSVEGRIDRRLKTPRDFDYLAMRIYDSQKSYISAMSLKRFWGYLGQNNQTVPRYNTLNLLAQFVGYKDWPTFCKSSSGNAEVQSEFILNDTTYASSLSVGIKLRLIWQPDRMLLMEYQGHEQFKVIESINSKLSVGDTYCCGQFINGAPLYLNRLIHEGSAPMNYVCGKDSASLSGADWHILLLQLHKFERCL